MNALTAKWLARLKPEEGGYTNDALDAGGETNHGITEFVARAFGYTGSMRDMTWEQAMVIYEARYVVQPAFDQLALIDPGLAWKLFDIGVNMGQNTGGMFLQRALNLLNNGGTDYPDMKVDGVCGAITRAAIRALYAKRGKDGREVLMFMVTSGQGIRYMEIAEAKPTQERFIFGWERARAMLQPEG